MLSAIFTLAVDRQPGSAAGGYAICAPRARAVVERIDERPQFGSSRIGIPKGSTERLALDTAARCCGIR